MLQLEEKFNKISWRELNTNKLLSIKVIGCLYHKPF